MRIVQRQKRQNAIAVKRLTGNRLMRFFGSDSGNQRMMAVVPERQRYIRFVAQPGVCSVGADHQPGGQHLAILQAEKCFVFSPRHLLQLSRGQQRDVGATLRLLPQRMMNDRIFNNMAKVAEAHTLVIKADVAKAVLIPHFHTVITAGAPGDNLRPDIQPGQQFFAGGVNG